MLNSQKVIIIILKALHESQLLHSHEILLREAKLIFICWIEFIDICCVPSKLVVRDVELDLLAWNVEMGRIGDRYEIDWIYLISVSEENGVY